MASFRESCRKCFIEKGYSIVLEKRDGTYYCRENPKHKYVKDESGKLVPAD